jgi:hypothetical protein
MTSPIRTGELTNTAMAIFSVYRNFPSKTAGPPFRCELLHNPYNPGPSGLLWLKQGPPVFPLSLEINPK